MYQTTCKQGSLLLIGMIVGVGVLLSSKEVYAYDTSNKNQGKVVTSPKVDTSIPSWFKPMETDNLNDRLDILPKHLQKYRSSTQFMVVPAMGMITPIVELSHDNPDRKLATKGGNFDYNKYLIAGPTIYPGTASVGNPGNTFIFAHSNYWHDKPGDFKTIFRLTYNIEKGDSIWYFKKTGSTWRQYTYQVTKSMLINETDVRVMFPEKGKTELTLSACRPIGTAKQRRINKATLIDSKTIDYEIMLNPGDRTIKDNSKTTTKSGDVLSGMVYNPGLTDLNAVKAALQLVIESIKRIIYQP